MNSTASEPSLPRRFVLYVPIEQPEGLALCEVIQLVLCERLGGVTSYPAHGIFRMADGRRTSEPVQVLEAYCEALEWADEHPFLIALAQVVGAILQQESIACAIDGRMEMITPPARQIGETAAIGASQSEKALTDLVLRQLT